jgi:hypothetical protein
MTLPAKAPTTISIKATEIATRIEMSAAASARPIHSAVASQMFSIIRHSPMRCPDGTNGVGDDGRRPCEALATKKPPGLG